MQKIVSIRYISVIVAGAIALAVIILSGSATADAQAGGTTAIGAYAQPLGSQSNIDAVIELENTLGTTLPIVRGFNQWDDSIGEDKPFHRWVRDGGRDLTISVKPTRNNGSTVRWADIANAQPGSQIYREIQDMANALRRFGEPVIFNFHHEPEQTINTHFGSSTDFRNAFRKVHSIFDAEGATNVQHAVILTEWGFEVGDFNANDRRRAELWYPGDDVVDIIGSDEYNWNNCRGNSSDPWISLEDDIAPFIRFANQHPGKRLMLGEFGSDVGSPGQKAQWLRDAQNYFSQSPDGDRFIALLYFHDDGRQEGFQQCEWWLDSSGASTSAAQAWFRDPAFRGGITGGGAAAPAPAPTPAPTPAPAPVTSPPNTVVPNPAGHPPCASAASDPDGNGYGWENNRSCVVVASTTPPTCAGRVPTIVGTHGNDDITGTSGNDVIVGLGGNDIIRGLAGDDIICGGAGDDLIRGSSGIDLIYGQGGNDSIYGGSGNDYIVGRSGDDMLMGRTGNDTLVGDLGDDACQGGAGADTLVCELEG